MEIVFLKKIIEILVKFLEGLFKKKALKDDCKKAGDKVSKAIRELFSLKPNLNKVRSLLSEAEKLCPNDSEDLYKAREMLETLQVASRSFAISASSEPKPATARGGSGRKVAKKKVTKRKVVKKKTPKNYVTKKKVAKKKVAKKRVARKKA